MLAVNNPAHYVMSLSGAEVYETLQIVKKDTESHRSVRDDEDRFSPVDHQ